MKYSQGILVPIRAASLVAIVAIAIINTNEFITLQTEKTLHHVFHSFYFVFSIATVTILFVDALDILLQFQPDAKVAARQQVADSPEQPIPATMTYWRGLVASLAQSMTITVSLLWIGFLIVEISFNSRQVYATSLTALLSLYILFLALRINIFIQLPEYQSKPKTKTKGFVPKTKQLMQEEYPLLFHNHRV